ncbi:MAG: hypothetical protein F2757_02545, partial [Actinobacteria bacterium]|nr:hypothetical protein [Actinomycetota bacterium]
MIERLAGMPVANGTLVGVSIAPELVAPDVIDRVLAEAVARGGEMAEVFCEDRTSRTAMFDDGRVEELASGQERGAGIRVILGETTGFAHTADLSEAGLLEAARAAAAVAKQGGGGTNVVGLEKRRAYSTNAVRLHDDVATSEKLELLAKANDAARSVGGSISQVQASYAEGRRRILVATT